MLRLRAVSRVLLVAVSLALVVAACDTPVQPPAAHDPAINPENIGFNVAGIGPRDVADRELAALAATGAKWVRVDLNWSTLAPTRTTRNWAPADHYVALANSLGLHILAQITYTPDWEGTLPNPTDLGEWAGELAARYAPFGVHTWEIWNEANLKGPWPGAPDPVLYTQLLKAAYTNIHAHDSQATVVSSGLSPAPDQPSWALRPYTFLRAMYDNGAKGYFDAVGLHITMTPFEVNAPQNQDTWNPTYSAVTQMYPLMQAMGDGNKKIWATEAGYSTTVDPSKGVSESRQAPLLEDLMSTWLHKSFAGPVFAYTLRDPGTDQNNWFDMMGLLREDFSHKPAYDAITNYIQASATN